MLGHGETRNFVSWVAEFGEIFCGKLWALVICVDCYYVITQCLDVDWMTTGNINAAGLDRDNEMK